MWEIVRKKDIFLLGGCIDQILFMSSVQKMEVEENNGWILCSKMKLNVL